MHNNNIPADIKLRVHSADAENSNYKSLLIAQARQLNAKWTSEVINIGLSGGLDSEAVACAFIESGARFEVSILRFNDGLNSHDMSHAIYFCEKNKIKYNFFDLDIIDFLESEKYFAYTDEYQCTSPQVTSHLWLRQATPHPIVFSGQAFRLQFKPSFISLLKNRPERMIYEFQNHISLIEPPTPNEYLESATNKTANANSELNFLSMTEELRAAAAIADDPFKRQLSAQSLCQKHPQSNFAFNQYFQEKYIGAITKHHFFKNCGLDVSNKPMKYTGFERVHYYYSLNDKQSKSDYLRKSALSNNLAEDSDFVRQFAGLLEFNKKFRKPMQEHITQKREIILDFSKEFLETIRAKLLTDWSESCQLLKNSL